MMLRTCLKRCIRTIIDVTALACLACASVNSPTSLQSVALSEDEKCVSKDYVEVVRKAIDKCWYERIPLAAMQGLPGTVLLHFDIMPDGTISNIIILSSSGRNSMEAAARDAVKAASPLPPPKFKESSCDRESVTLHFYYNMEPDNAQE